MILEILMVFSAVSFLIFGISCFTTHHMKSEFERYQLGGFRQLTGILQICGGLVLIVGFNWKWAIYLGSGGLAFLMLFGFLVRIKIQDGFWRSSPAFIYMIINLLILFLVDNRF